MRKLMSLLVVMILMQCVILAGKSFAYTVQWSDMKYYSGISANGTWVAEDYVNGDVSYGTISTPNLAKATSGNPTLKAQALSHVMTSGAGASADTQALTLVYGKLTITGSGPVVTSKITGSAAGSLTGSVTGDGWFNSSIGGGIMIYSADNGFQTLINSVKANGDLTEANRIWAWRYNKDGHGGDGFDFQIDNKSDLTLPYNYNLTDAELVTLNSGQEYYFLAGMGANASVGAQYNPGYDYSAALASSDFYNSMNFNIEEGSAAVPEPVTMVLFGMGLIGGAVARRKRSPGHQDTKSPVK